MPLCKAIIAEAHARNLKVVAHVFYLNDAKQLVDAGLDFLAHSVRDAPVDDALIASMKKHGAWMGAATLSRELSVFAYANAARLAGRSVLPAFGRGDVVNTLKSPDYQKTCGFAIPTSRSFPDSWKWRKRT